MTGKKHNARDSKSPRVRSRDSDKNLSKKQDSTEKTSERSENKASNDKFPIIAIGASAGGLDALRQLLDNTPPDSDCAFIIVMHLSPEHESHLEPLLQPHTQMAVRQVNETVALEKNCVYLIPPNANLNAIDSSLRLSELEPTRRRRAPIDHFFRTLPQAHDAGIIGILLSGTGSDGTLGLRKIKEYNGLTIVQDPSEAEFGGMAQSAIAAMAVDAILPVAEIPASVMRFVETRPSVKKSFDAQEKSEPTHHFLEKVFATIRTQTGRDFTNYKHSTMLRRTLRRMQFNHLSETDEYLELLTTLPDETQALADDFLITITSFFRDQAVYEIVEQEIIPSLFTDKGPEDTVRVWSVGCATGEEAYSVAMLLIEEAERCHAAPSIQIFASDLHKESLDMARDGFYPGDIEQDVDAKRLERFFFRENGCYRVRKEVRELIVFAPHNLLADPPFSRIDLLICRNLLIYLQRSLQQQVAELFHYALKEDGFLVLGSSESIEGSDLYQTINKKQAIYRRKKVPVPEVRLPVFPLTRSRAPKEFSRPDAGHSQPLAYDNLHHHFVELYGPPSILLSPDDNVVHSSAQAGRYLIHPGGLPTSSIFKIIHEDLRIELRTSLSKVRRERCAVRTQPVSIRLDGKPLSLVLDLRPAETADQDGFILVIFNESPRLQTRQDQTQVDETEALKTEKHESRRVRELEEEKLLAEQRMQQLIADHESGQEELKASNEELQSANEELRSTLEELETSKEELQSANEELQTLNQENRHKVEELDQLSSDLQNLLVATDIATLFLDRHNRIVRFTPKIEQLFNIQSIDRGRALSDFTTHLSYSKLGEDIRKVIEHLVPIEREVQGNSGQWYLSRILPYRDVQDRIAGTVVTFVDITGLKQAEEEVRQAKETSEKILYSLPIPLLVLTPELRVYSANSAFYDHFKVDSSETQDKLIYDLGNRQWDIPRLRHLLERVLSEKREFSGYEVDHVFERLGRRVILLEARRLDNMNLVLLGIHDITERRQAEEQLRESSRRKDEYLAMLGHELRNPLGAIRNAAEILQSKESGDERLSHITGVLNRQTAHMSQIIDGLLDVSRIVRGKIKLNLQAVDLRHILEGVLDTRNTDIIANDLELKMDMASEPIWVMGDEVRLTQVFDNILSNAIKFTQPSGTIIISGQQDGQEAVVRVRDTGVGIKPKHLSDIFESFQQGRQDVARTSGGLGLGLSLVKGLLVLHKGSIEAHSEGPGTGSEFLIRLPTVAAGTEKSAAQSANELAPLMMLVVEDNEDAALMIRELLESHGHQITVAESAKVALKTLYRHTFDVVLCDIGLPGMNGYDLAQAIRSEPELHKLPLIAVTGYGQVEDRRRALEAGFNEHLTKPVELEELNVALRSII